MINKKRNLRILLFGEFSSLHKYLKDGLETIDGIDVVLYSQGDGWKRIKGSDKNIPIYDGNNIIDRIFFYIKYFNLILKIRNYDIIQLINTQVFPIGLSKLFVYILKRNNKYISLAAAGEDYPLVVSYYQNKFNTYIYDYDHTILNVYKDNKKGKLKISDEMNIIEQSDIIIPSLYEYSLGYSHHYPVIPFPINIDSIKYRDNIVNNKIIIFHGLNRETAKGTRFIREALKRIKKKYPDKVEIIIDGHMPFEKYTKVMMKANIVIDQCLTYGYGINACIAMAQGKVVLAPCHKETLDSFKISEAPIINIYPDSNQIFKQLEYLVLNSEQIPEIGRKSRDYVEKMHNYKIIAEKYLNAWLTVINKDKIVYEEV